MLFAERKDVVAKNIFASVMLMKASALAAINNIILQHDSAAAFVSVKSPAAVSEGVHIVDQIVAEHGARLRTKRIDPAHIAEPEFADVVQMVELDDIRAAGRFTIAPGPAHRNR